MPPAGPQLNPDALRALREANGYSVAAFASRIGIAPAHLSNVESGRRGVSVAIVKQMTDALRVPPAAILAMGECKTCAAGKASGRKTGRAA